MRCPISRGYRNHRGECWCRGRPEASRVPICHVSLGDSCCHHICLRVVRTDAMVDANDEFMHHPGPRPVWQESFFFSWFDPRSDATGLARIGYRPSNHTADALLYTMRNGRVEGGYARLNARYSGTPDPGRLGVGALEFHMSEPMSKW